MCCFTGSLFIQHKVLVFVTKTSHSLTTFCLSASSKWAPPAACDAGLSGAHKLLSNEQLGVFCWPNPPC